MSPSSTNDSETSIFAGASIFDLFIIKNCN
jgi:hypothetical protein